VAVKFLAMIDNPIQEIKDRLAVTDVLADYVQLKKAGANFKAICPFHNEKTPSLMISPAKQVWRCFGCGLGGDIFEFVKLSENVEFAEALKILADRAGIELKKPTQQEVEVSKIRHTLYDINAAAAKYFEKVLWESRAGHEALLYLRGRGLNDQTIKSWQLGFAPDDYHYLETFLSKNYPQEDIVLAGLAVKNEQGRVYDRFRGRVMFPILNIHGQVVGFTGRIMKDQKDAAKYVNSPETPVYNKSKELFGLYQAKNEIRKANRVVLVEGNMDVISSHQAGLLEAVAASGTALGAGQLSTLKRFTENLIFAFDTDAAGMIATRRALEEALNLGFNVKIADMKEAKDPDELIRRGISLWRKAVDTAPNFAEYFFDSVLQKRDLGTVEAKREAAKDLAPLIMRMADPVTRGHFVRKLSKGIDVAEQAIWDIINKLSLPKVARPQKAEEKRKNRREILEEQLLGLCLTAQDFSPLQDFAETDFMQNTRNLFMLLKTKGAVTPEQIRADQPDLAAKLELVTFTAQVETEQNGWVVDKELVRIKTELKKLVIKEQMQEIAEQLKTADNRHDKNQVEALSKRFTELTQEMGKYNQ
jgi:DNA primase